MIDPHVHLRDWDEKHKETVKHGLEVAYKAGLDAVFEMPNTSPALTDRYFIERRMKLADIANIPIFHGLYAGLTVDPKQIKEVVRAYEDLFPRVVGLKMFAGHSTGNMGLISKKEQDIVYKTLTKLNYKGILAVHCEYEQILHPKLWNPKKPISHCLARGYNAELASIIIQKDLASSTRFEGTLYIVHASAKRSISAVGNGEYKTVYGITPHHCLLYDEMMQYENGLLLKMNPPLRDKHTQAKLLQNIFYEDEINKEHMWIETDHAPHTLKEKIGAPYASGIPGLPFYPAFIKSLRLRGVSQKRIDALTHDNIINAFGIDPALIPNTGRAGTQSDEELDKLAKEYEFDPFEKIKI